MVLLFFLEHVCLRSIRRKSIHLPAWAQLQERKKSTALLIFSFLSFGSFLLVRRQLWSFEKKGMGAQREEEEKGRRRRSRRGRRRKRERRRRRRRKKKRGAFQSYLRSFWSSFYSFLIFLYYFSSFFSSFLSFPFLSFSESQLSKTTCGLSSMWLKFPLRLKSISISWCLITWRVKGISSPFLVFPGKVCRSCRFVALESEERKMKKEERRKKKAPRNYLNYLWWASTGSWDISFMPIGNPISLEISSRSAK